MGRLSALTVPGGPISTRRYLRDRDAGRTLENAGY
jgi:hypothetical protein